MRSVNYSIQLTEIGYQNVLFSRVQRAIEEFDIFRGRSYSFGQRQKHTAARIDIGKIRSSGTSACFCEGRRDNTVWYGSTGSVLKTYVRLRTKSHANNSESYSVTLTSQDVGSSATRLFRAVYRDMRPHNRWFLYQ